MNKYDVFITETFESDIYNNVIKGIYPNLLSSHQLLLQSYLINLLNIIACVFYFDLNKREIYEHQFRQNNYRDVIAILLYLTPFISADDNNQKKNSKVIRRIIC